MKIVYLTTSLFLFTFSISKAQQASLTIGLGKPLTTHSVTGVIGSPYLTDNFQNSEVTTPGGNILKDVPLKYNVYNQTIECMINSQVYDVTDSVRRFSYTDSLAQMNVFFGQIGKTIYYKLLVKNTYSLVKTYKAELTSDEDWYTKKVTKRYVTKTDYFLFDGNKIIPLGTSKKSFLAAFNNNPAIKQQFDKESPDLKDESSLINFFKELK